MNQPTARTEPAPSLDAQRQQDAAGRVALAELGEAIRDLSLALNMNPAVRLGRVGQVAMAIERAAGRLRRGMLAEGLGSDAAAHPEAALHQAAYELHVAADGPAVIAGVIALREAASHALLRFREYEAHHLAKPDPEKAQRNANMAEELEAALFPRTSNDAPARAELSAMLRALAAGDAKMVRVADLEVIKEVATGHDLRGMANFITHQIERRFGDE